MDALAGAASVYHVRMPAIGRLRYLEAAASGTGRPRGTLVLIHGFPLNARMWQPQMTFSEQGWRVIAPQLRGMDGGASDPPAITMDDHAADVIDLMDALHIEDAVVGGLSMGGYVTFAVFRHAASYFRGIILADTRSQADTPEGVEGRRRMLKTVKEQGAAEVADEMIPKLLGEDTRQNQPNLADHVRSLILSNSPEAIGHSLTALMTRPDSTSLLSSIRCPALVVVGNEDTLTPPPLSHEIHGAIAGSELVVIPRAGHLSNLEQPAAFNAAVGRFLEHRI